MHLHGGSDDDTGDHRHLERALRAAWRRGITSALFLTAAGFLVGTSALGWLDVSVESAVAERVAELALVLLLFSDATRLDLTALRTELAWPSRLLLIGLPLTMLAGTVVGALVFPGMALASVVLLATMLASTDAALGQKVVSDPNVPARLRRRPRFRESLGRTRFDRDPAGGGDGRFPRRRHLDRIRSPGPPPHHLAGHPLCRAQPDAGADGSRGDRLRRSGCETADGGVHRLVRPARTRLARVRAPRSRARCSRRRGRADDRDRHRRTECDPAWPDLGATGGRLPSPVRGPSVRATGGGGSGAGEYVPSPTSIPGVDPATPGRSPEQG
ncbi:MAG: cation:proton antiporter [Ramlibacter sp.]|nr:cation:proton antiporter [Cryobacterium sp.]